MGMASGESAMYFGTEVGKWGAEGAAEFFLACRRGKFFLTHVSILKMPDMYVCTRIRVYTRIRIVCGHCAWFVDTVRGL